MTENTVPMEKRGKEMELIKREDVHKLISSLDHYIWKNPNQYNSNLPDFKETVGVDDLHFEIDKLSTVDAVPVRHGHWVKWDDESTYDCSICGDAFTLYEGTPKSNHYNYCPCRGATMDEVSE